MARRIKAGSTDVSVVIRIIDSTDGTPETAFVFNSAGIDLAYRREGAARVAITEATLAALTTAHADGGFLHISDGYYRLDLPDLAVAAGATGVLVTGTITGGVVIGEYVELVAYDPADAVRLGLTALPNAAADAAGGLPISDAGGLDLDTKLANTNEVTAARMGALTDWINGGRLDLLLDAILADTAEIGAAGAGLTEAGGTGDQLTALATAANLATVAGYLDTEIAAILEDTGTTLPALLADIPTVAEFNARTLVAASYATAAALTTVDTVVDAIKVITDALTSAAAAKLALSAAGIISGAAATGTLTTTAISTDLTGYANDQLNGAVIIFTSGDAAGERREITDYVATNGVVSFAALTTAPANGDTFVIV